MRIVLAGLLLSLLPTVLHAQSPTYVLPDSIVVTASRLAESARTSAQRVTVLTATDIAALPVASFDELLRSVGGMEVQSRGGFGVQSDLTMRGSTFNGVLLLLDGVRLNDPMTGHFLSDFPIPLAEIARVEVLRGPATALYGPDALGGVIQVFTFTGLRHLDAERSGTDLAAKVQVGEHALYDAEGSIRHHTPRTTVSAATAWQGSDGQPILDAEGLAIRGSMGDLRTDFSRQAHTVAVSHRLNAAMLFARAGMDDRDFGAYRFYTPFASDTAREATSTYWAHLRATGQTSSGARWTLNGTAKQHDDRYVYNPVTPANEHTSRRFAVDGHATHALAPTLRLTAGADAAWRSIDSNNLGQHDDASAGGFVSTTWQPALDWTVRGSGRLDYDPGFGWEATPQVNIGYSTAMVGLRAGVGRAVRAPNYVERYFNTTLARPRGRSLGNPDLEAEQALSYEAGLDVYPTDGLALHATAFRRITDNLIDYVKVTPADTVFLARNLFEVDTRGLELDGTLQASAFDLRLSYTLLDATLNDAEQVAEYKYALTNARHILQVQGNVQLGAVRVGLHGLWKEPLDSEAYGVVGARVQYGFTWGTRRLALSLDIRNLFDTACTEVFDAPMPGRWFIAGLRVLQ
ncbi:MAG: TonB-dependent receptor plug domain-containing protein [Rhodothermales bacterium]